MGFVQKLYIHSHKNATLKFYEITRISVLVEFDKPKSRIKSHYVNLDPVTRLYIILDVEPF